MNRRQRSFVCKLDVSLSLYHLADFSLRGTPCFRQDEPASLSAPEKLLPQTQSFGFVYCQDDDDKIKNPLLTWTCVEILRKRALFRRNGARAEGSMCIADDCAENKMALGDLARNFECA